MPDNEKEAMLRRAFVDHRADYIIIESRRERRQIESAAYGEERGWLKSAWRGDDPQSRYLEYRLTDEGREYFGIPRLI